MKGMQMRPFVGMIKGMYEFAFSVYTIEANIIKLDAQEHASMPSYGFKLSSMFV